MLVPGKRLQVFSIKEVVEKNEKKSMWVKAGSAWVNRDGSMNVYLDVLPIDGKLHVREQIERRDEKSNTNNSSNPQANGSQAAQHDSMGGH